jgi:hypothetical protein
MNWIIIIIIIIIIILYSVAFNPQANYTDPGQQLVGDVGANFCR